MEPGIDYIGVGVGAVIVNDDGKVFLAKRGKKARNEQGTWKIPGGAVEFGEQLEEALRREIKEEHDIDIEIIKLLNVSNHIISEEKQHWVAPIFLCKITQGTPKIMEPDKCEEIGWFNLEEIQELPLAPSTKENFETFSSEIRAV